ncbi:hypothetical protein T11_11681 [Trichinella zimbabwensis]|uniref:Uncharacterized protein n=1 Tax=Trichinella zimbabwensis TaxID=268475 RepID=A0A0V1GLF9_9BILA|nr:hypothetical protein T11_11681 [Trichinella zimbabwensis]
MLVPFQESFRWATFLCIKIGIMTTLDAIYSTTKEGGKFEKKSFTKNA